MGDYRVVKEIHIEEIFFPFTVDFCGAYFNLTFSYNPPADQENPKLKIKMINKYIKILIVYWNSS